MLNPLAPRPSRAPSNADNHPASDQVCQACPHLLSLDIAATPADYQGRQVWIQRMLTASMSFGILRRREVGVAGAGRIADLYAVSKRAFYGAFRNGMSLGRNPA